MSDISLLNGIQNLAACGNNTLEMCQNQFGANNIQRLVQQGFVSAVGGMIMWTAAGHHFMSPIESNTTQYNDGNSSLLFS